MLFTDGQANQGPRTADAICRAMRDLNYKPGQDDRDMGFYGPSVTQLPRRINNNNNNNNNNINVLRLSRQQPEPPKKVKLEQRKSLKNLWGLLGGSNDDNDKDKDKDKKGKNDKKEKEKEKRRATVQTVPSYTNSNDNSSMMGNVSTVSSVNYSAALNQQQGVLPIDYSVTQVNQNTNSNVTTNSSSVISQPGLYSQNLATNTGTSTSNNNNNSSTSTNNNNNTTSNTNSSTVTQPGANGNDNKEDDNKDDNKNDDSKQESEEGGSGDEKTDDSNSKKAIKKATKKKEKASLDKDDDEEDDLLPCTVYTFGFGTNHNAELLEKIAESGRGMYVFIENKDMIAESFAECLGGLVSIVGKNLELKIMALNNCKILKCLSQGYKTEISKNKLECKIKIHDIQSEEARDLIFEFSLPKLKSANREWPMAQLSCKYENVVKKRQEVLSKIVQLARIDGKDTGERNEELDLQHNRLMAAEAMESADNLAQQGKLKEAREVLNVASTNISASVSKKSKYSQALVEDIGRCSKNLSSHTQYQNVGTKMLRMNKNAHYMQRSTQSSNYASQNMYANSSKMSYITSSQSHYS